METRWRRDGDEMETRWRRDGDEMETRWRRDGDALRRMTQTPLASSQRSPWPYTAGNSVYAGWSARGIHSTPERPHASGCSAGLGVAGMELEALPSVRQRPWQSSCSPQAFSTALSFSRPNATPSCSRVAALLVCLPYSYEPGGYSTRLINSPSGGSVAI